LEGDWGRGKSTIVNLLCARLAKNEDFLVVVFDAWAHQGDPLRRTFLERAINAAIAKGWIDKAKWVKRLEELRHRRKRSRTVETPALTYFAKWFAASLFISTLGFGLFLTGLTEKLDWAIIAGAVATASPLYVLFWKGIGLFREPGQSAKDDDKSGWALFVAKTVSETVSETSDTPDPTSVEFQDIFTDVMNEALAHPKRRVVLVLDNLDRVDAKDALAMWSTMQTFVQHSGGADPTWFPRLWVLLPYDRKSVLRLWQEEAAGSRGTSFLDKSISVRFEVPLPVLSDWQAYLGALLGEALPVHDAGEFHAAYQVYALYTANAGHRPAPRDLKLYVNMIGALHRQWHDEIPLGDLAYYSLLWRDQHDVADALVSERIPEDPLRGIVSDEIIDHLAMLVFNVEVERARELLLTDSIRAAFAAGDGEKLRSIAQSNDRGFWPVLEGMVGGDQLEWASTVGIAKAAVSFRDSQLLEMDLPAARMVRSQFSASFKLVTDWTPMDSEIQSGIIAALEMYRGQDDIARRVLQGLGSTPPAGPVDAGKWVAVFVEVARTLSGQGKRIDSLVEAVAVPGDANMFFEVCQELGTRDPNGELWRLLQATAAPENLVAPIEALIPNGQMNGRAAGGLQVMAAAGVSASWDPVVQAI